MGPSNIDELDRVVADIKADWAKFTGGNKSAGTRVRKACQELKAVAKALRDEVQEIKGQADEAK